MIKTILVLFLSGFFLFPTQSQTFQDVPPSAYYYSAVERVYAANIMVGYEDGLFHPEDGLSRAQAAIIIEKAAFGITSTPPPTNTYLFDDMDEEDYYRGYVEDFGQRGITVGCGERLFCPYDGVTREQMATFIIKSLGEFNPPAPISQRFNDVPLSSPFAAFIDRLAELNISAGCGDNQFCPQRPVTRGEAAIFLTLAYNL